MIHPNLWTSIALFHDVPNISINGVLFIFIFFQDMRIHDTYHQNLLLVCLEELMNFAFDGSHTSEYQVVTGVEFGDHKMIKFCFPSLQKCVTCDKVRRGSLSDGYLCRGLYSLYKKKKLCLYIRVLFMGRGYYTSVELKNRLNTGARYAYRVYSCGVFPTHLHKTRITVVCGDIAFDLFITYHI